VCGVRARVQQQRLWWWIADLYHTVTSSQSVSFLVSVIVSSLSLLEALLLAIMLNVQFFFSLAHLQKLGVLLDDVHEDAVDVISQLQVHVALFLERLPNLSI